MFLDEVEIEVVAGSGGAGAVSFHREKYVPRGGPDGGDGGRGGSVVLVAVRNIDTLSRFERERRFRAGDGKPGMGNNRAGAAGKDVVLKVPVGTIVFDASGNPVADMSEEGMEFVAARGGRGGRGNARFASSRRQAPRFAENGEAGESVRLRMELKLVADVGLIGLPNAGKSTLLSRISRARPTIADYPFTTTRPYLGIVTLSGHRSLVVADLPGLIEGASRGVGLGDRFLKHCERTRVLVHLLDGTLDDPIANYRMIRAELKNFSGALENKRELVVINKVDAIDSGRRQEIIRSFSSEEIEIRFISAVTGGGIGELLEELYSVVQTIPRPEFRTRKEYTFKKPFWIESREGRFFLGGEEFDRLAHRFNLSDEEGLRAFYRTFRKKGWEDKLVEFGCRRGDEVVIDDIVFEFRPDLQEENEERWEDNGL